VTFLEHELSYGKCRIINRSVFNNKPDFPNKELIKTIKTKNTLLQACA